MDLRQWRMQMRWRLWVRLHFVVTGLVQMGHSVATPRNPQRPFPHTDIAFMVCASLHDKLWFAISARGVVGSLLPLRLPNVMLMPVSKKGTALDKGGMLLAWWSNCVPLQLFDVQSVLMKQLIWKPCRHMWWATSPLANMFCTSTSLRLSSSWKVETEPSAMDSWFGAAPNGAGAERQVRPRTGRSSKDNEQLLTAVARLTLKNAQVCRNLESAVFVTYILAKEGAYAQAASAAGQTYAQRARAAGKNHTLGQPSSWVWAALTQAALKDEALSEEKRAMVKQHCDSVTDPAVLSDQVLYCRVSKVYDQTKVRLQISVAPGALSDVLTVLQDGMEKSGGLRKDGPAPRGALERQIQEIIGEPGVE